MFHRILVGVDDTPASSAALRQAIELVDAGHGRLGLLSSAPRPTMVGASPTIMPITRAELAQELIDWAQHNLAAAEEMVPQEIPVTKLLAHGSPWRALLREARSGRWDLIVVGQTHRAVVAALPRPRGRAPEPAQPNARFGRARGAAGAARRRRRAAPRLTPNYSNQGPRGIPQRLRFTLYSTSTSGSWTRDAFGVRVDVDPAASGEAGQRDSAVFGELHGQ